MPECTLTKWDDSGARTENFSVVFKALDFGNAASFKNISNIYVTCSNANSNTTLITLSYRGNTTDSYTTIGGFHTTSAGDEEIVNVKIRDIIKVKTFQLKLDVLQYTDGAFNISDVTILYRTLRDYTTEGDTGNEI